MNEPKVPLTQFIGDGDRLFRDLGKLWTRLYEDTEYIRRIQHSRALQGAQAALDVREAYAIANRNEVPVSHRTRWYPVKVSISSRDTSGTAFRFGMEPTPVFGEQTDPAFPAGTVFLFGRGVKFAGAVTYPVPANIVSAACITDNIAFPSAIYVRDRDFTIEHGCLVLKSYADPFADGSSFLVEGEGDGREATLWLCDAQSDRDYVSDHIGYAMGVTAASTDYNKDAVNAIWDAVTTGPTPATLQQALSLIFSAPVVKGEAETVESVSYAPDGSARVITDAGVYPLSDASELHAAVVPGAVLTRGAPLTTAITVYPPLINPTSAAVSRDYPDLRQRMPAVTLQPGFFSDTMTHGIALTWESVPIVYAGTDANGNPKLWFPLQGTAEDVANFWAGVWERCENENVSLRACFEGLIDDIVVARTGEVWGYVQPLDFMLRNLIGSNMVLVSVDADQLDADARKRVSPAFLELVRNTLPKGVCLFMTERRTADPDTYALDAPNVAHTTSRYFSRSCSSQGRYGMSPRLGLTYTDRRVSTRWIAICED